MPTTFPNEQHPSDQLTDWKKGKPRRRRYTGRGAAQAQEDEKRRKQRKPALENGRIEQHLRLGNEKQEIPDNGIWDVGYDTDSLAFLPPSQRFVKGSYN